MLVCLYPCPSVCICGSAVVRFIGFMEIEKGLDVGAARKAAVTLHLLKFLGLVVAPAALAQKGIEDENFLVIGAASFSKTPLQDFFVSSPGKGSLNHGWIFDVQEPADTQVRAGAVFVVWRQLALGVQPEFVQHSPKEDESTNL